MWRVHGLLFKRNADEILERRRRFLNRQMQDSILCSFGPVVSDASEREIGEHAGGRFAYLAQGVPFPMLIGVGARTFRAGLRDRTLPANVWYEVWGKSITVAEANALMDEVRAYRV